MIMEFTITVFTNLVDDNGFLGIDHVRFYVASFTRQKLVPDALEDANMKEDELIFVHWFFTRYVKANKKYLDTSALIGVRHV
jgi:hypothetical protein